MERVGGRHIIYTFWNGAASDRQPRITGFEEAYFHKAVTWPSGAHSPFYRQSSCCKIGWWTLEPQDMVTRARLTIR